MTQRRLASTTPYIRDICAGMTAGIVLTNLEGVHPQIDDDLHRLCLDVEAGVANGTRNEGGYSVIDLRELERAQQRPSPFISSEPLTTTLLALETHRRSIWYRERSRLCFVGGRGSLTTREYKESMAAGCVVFGDVPSDFNITDLVIDLQLLERGVQQAPGTESGERDEVKPGQPIRRLHHLNQKELSKQRIQLWGNTTGEQPPQNNQLFTLRDPSGGGEDDGHPLGPTNHWKVGGVVLRNRHQDSRSRIKLHWASPIIARRTMTLVLEAQSADFHTSHLWTQQPRGGEVDSEFDGRGETGRSGCECDRMSLIREAGRHRVLKHHSWQAVLIDWVMPAVDAHKEGVRGWYRSWEYVASHGRKYRHRHVPVLRQLVEEKVHELSKIERQTGERDEWVLREWLDISKVVKDHSDEDLVRNEDLFFQVMLNPIYSLIRHPETLDADLLYAQRYIYDSSMSLDGVTHTELPGLYSPLTVDGLFSQQPYLLLAMIAVGLMMIPTVLAIVCMTLARYPKVWRLWRRAQGKYSAPQSQLPLHTRPTTTPTRAEKADSSPPSGRGAFIVDQRGRKTRVRAQGYSPLLDKRSVDSPKSK
eukprot:GHVN01106723.1.p1 GENE.GHVN01106723.1~~GHVN01106723.1.p1  ORF type:complete len:608 (-),score=120.45 GHVN01106723.1:1679-3448(-)